MAITCAADVHSVFPDALIDHEELLHSGGVHAFAKCDTVRIQGHPTYPQLEAILYWRAHPEEFKPASEPCRTLARF